MKTVQQYVELIEGKFAQYVDKIGRSDVKWGIWSREMNLELRKRIESEDVLAPQLSMVFNLWICYSQLLDLRMKYKGKYFGANKIKQKIREIQRLKVFLNEDHQR